jgi:hypothetical protein
MDSLTPDILTPLPESYGEGRTLTSTKIAICIVVIASIGGESAKAIESKRSGY